MDNVSNRVKKIITKKDKSPIDADVLKYLIPLSEELEISVEELALSLHTQGIYVFDDLEDILGIDPLEE